MIVGIIERNDDTRKITVKQSDVLCVVLADSGELLLQTPRFVRDTSQLWHRPNISRDEGILL